MNAHKIANRGHNDDLARASSRDSFGRKNGGGRLARIINRAAKKAAARRDLGERLKD